TSSGISKHAAKRSAPWWGDYEPDYHRQDQGQRGAGGPRALWPVRPVADRAVVLGNRPGAAVHAGIAHRLRAHRRRGRKPGCGATLFGRLGTLSRASLFLPPDRLDHIVDPGDDRHLDAAARDAAAPVAPGLAP